MNRIAHAVAVTIALIALIAPMGVANAQNNMLGRFNGFCQNNLRPEAQDSFFDVFTQRRGRFHGTFVVPGEVEPCWFECDGSVMPNGIVTGSGRHEDHIVVFAGRTRVVGALDPKTDGIRLMSLLYAVYGRSGNLMDWGVTLHIQMQGGPGWFDPPAPITPVSGHWMGDFKSRGGPGGGAMTMDLAQQRNERTEGLTTAFGGTANLMHVYVPAVQSFFDVFLDLKGTVGLPAVQRDGSMVSQFGAISVEKQPGPIQSPGIIAILIGLLKDPGPQQLPAVQGNYRLYSSFFDVFLDVMFDGGAAFDQGAFSANPGPIQ